MIIQWEKGPFIRMYTINLFLKSMICSSKHKHQPLKNIIINNKKQIIIYFL